MNQNYQPFELFADQCRQRLNAALETQLPEADPQAPQLAQAMAYSLRNGGKRVRPTLVYASAAALGQEANPGLDKVAIALEAIHAYSLVHDDLPAMDDDDLRRGQPSCHIAFDQATAILAGDALQTLAFEWLVSASELAPEVRNRLVLDLAQASGCQGMVLGQAIDLSAVNQELDLASLERMHRHKTGALIRASVLMGARASGAGSQELEQLDCYAQAIGLAFQVQDDILDVVADTQVLGKRQGADSARHKPTYVSLLGLDQAREKARGLLNQALEALAPFDAKADPLRALARYIVERNH